MKRMSEDIILIGENHTQSKCAKETYEIINNTKPKAILYEALDKELKGRNLLSTEKLQKYTGVEVPNKDPVYLWELEDFEEYLNKILDKISELEELYLNACNDNMELSENLYKEVNRLSCVFNKISNCYELLSKNYRNIERYLFMFSDIANEIPVLPLDDEEAKKKQIELLRQDPFYKFLLRQDKSTNDKELKALNEKREETMAENIRKAVEKYGTPVIAVMGASHLKGVKKRLEGGLLNKISNRILNRGYKVKTINLNKYELDAEGLINELLYVNEILEGKDYE